MPIPINQWEYFVPKYFISIFALAIFIQLEGYFQSHAYFLHLIFCLHFQLSLSIWSVHLCSIYRLLDTDTFRFILIKWTAEILFSIKLHLSKILFYRKNCCLWEVPPFSTTSLHEHSCFNITCKLFQIAHPPPSPTPIKNLGSCLKPRLNKLINWLLPASYWEFLYTSF